MKTKYIGFLKQMIAISSDLTLAQQKAILTSLESSDDATENTKQALEDIERTIDDIYFEYDNTFLGRIIILSSQIYLALLCLLFFFPFLVSLVSPVTLTIGWIKCILVSIGIMAVRDLWLRSKQKKALKKLFEQLIQLAQVI